MIKIMIGIILAPFALVAAGATLAIAFGIVKGLFSKDKK